MSVSITVFCILCAVNLVDSKLRILCIVEHLKRMNGVSCLSIGIGSIGCSLDVSSFVRMFVSTIYENGFRYVICVICFLKWMVTRTHTSVVMVVAAQPKCSWHKKWHTIYQRHFIVSPTRHVLSSIQFIVSINCYSHACERGPSSSESNRLRKWIALSHGCHCFCFTLR